MSVTGRNSVCRYRERLGAFLDGEVSPDERRRIAAHLNECAACRRRLQELRGLAVALKAYRVPARLWRSDAEFWQDLAPQLHPRAMPAHRDPTTRPSPFLAPVGLVVSGIALRGLVAFVLLAYALDQWRLLPASLSAAFASAVKLSLGPLAWEAIQTLHRNLVTSPAPLFVAPRQFWLLAFEATASALLLLLSGLYIGWLLRWLRGEVALQPVVRTE